MKPELIEEIQEMLDSMGNISSGWYLPSGSNNLIKTPDGHLSVLHTSLLKKWIITLQKVIDSEYL